VVVTYQTGMPVSSAQPTQIPDGLDLVIDFVNTLDLEEGEDALATPDAVAVWLRGRGLITTSTPVGSEEQAHAVRLREALRALMSANAHGREVAAGSELERTARAGDLGVHFAPGGAVAVQPGDPGFAGALATLLVPVASAMASGSWQRVKACRDPNCQWAFYDRSRNRSGVWCAMAVCGNRTKVRAYRRRGPRAGR
jgi:predicted RNA-binding Zn ribbon-like protein